MIRTDPRQTKGISKPAWIVVQIVLPVIGAILWFLIGRPRGTVPARANYSHPIAPDDDPDFLRNLEFRRRKQAEADRLKKLKDELDAKERKLDDGKGTPALGHTRVRRGPRQRRHAGHRRGQVDPAPAPAGLLFSFTRPLTRPTSPPLCG